MHNYVVRSHACICMHDYAACYHACIYMQSLVCVCMPTYALMQFMHMCLQLCMCVCVRAPVCVGVRAGALSVSVCLCEGGGDAGHSPQHQQISKGSSRRFLRPRSSCLIRSGRQYYLLAAMPMATVQQVGLRCVASPPTLLSGFPSGALGLSTPVTACSCQPL